MYYIVNIEENNLMIMIKYLINWIYTRNLAATNTHGKHCNLWLQQINVNNGDN